MMMNEYDYGENGGVYEYNDFGGFRESDEDTEDASETESMKPFNDDYEYCMDVQQYEMREGYQIKEQIYREQLKALRDQLEKLDAEMHPDFVAGLDQIRKVFDERRFFLHCCFEWTQDRIQNDYLAEERAANQEFNDRRIELKENLISDLEEKRRLFEADTLELAFDTTEPKPTTTRKLRRRPNDPIPMPDRRRRASPAHINYMLDDSEIADDLKLIAKAATMSTKSLSKEGKSSKADREEKASCSGSSSTKNQMASSSYDYEGLYTEARIEDGKLFYDKKWFHRGQNIMIDSQADGSKCTALIVQIGSNEIYVRKPNESLKSKVTLTDLQARKYVIHRRS